MCASDVKRAFQGRRRESLIEVSQQPEEDPLNEDRQEDTDDDVEYEGGIELRRIEEPLTPQREPSTPQSAPASSQPPTPHTSYTPHPLPPVSEADDEPMSDEPSPTPGAVPDPKNQPAPRGTSLDRPWEHDEVAL